MKHEFPKIWAVLRRELWEMRSGRILAVFGLFTLFQGALMFVSKDTGRIEDAFLIFMLGGLAAVLIGFDGFAREREQRTMDLLLTQGISRWGLYAAKWLSLILLCFAAAGIAILGGMIGSLLSGKPLARLDFLAEFAATAWLLSVYGAMALTCSAALRRGKWALIAAIIVWMVFRPMVIGTLVLGPVSHSLGLSKNQTWGVAAFLPEFAFRFVLDAGHAAPPDVSVPAWFPYAALGAYLVGFSLIGWLIFRRQDEPAI
jgi:ABC-type transport system involved in multi-copper enzyme maturation permease subunit